MSYRIFTAALLAVAGTTPALAQQFNGGSVSGLYKENTDDGSDFGGLSFQGGIEFGLGTSFAIGANLAAFEYSDFSDDETLNLTLHGMYMLSPNSALGLCVGQDTTDFTDVTTYGVEGGTTSGQGRFEGYYGIAEVDEFSDADITIAGFVAEVGFGNGFAVGIEYESVTTDDGILFAGEDEDITVADTALYLQYTISDGPAIYAEIGQNSAF